MNTSVKVNWFNISRSKASLTSQEFRDTKLRGVPHVVENSVKIGTRVYVTDSLTYKSDAFHRRHRFVPVVHCTASALPVEFQIRKCLLTVIMLTASNSHIESVTPLCIPTQLS